MTAWTASSMSLRPWQWLPGHWASSLSASRTMETPSSSWVTHLHLAPSPLHTLSTGQMWLLVWAPREDASKCNDSSQPIAQKSWKAGWCSETYTSLLAAVGSWSGASAQAQALTEQSSSGIECRLAMLSINWPQLTALCAYLAHRVPSFTSNATQSCLLSHSL